MTKSYQTRRLQEMAGEIQQNINSAQPESNYVAPAWMKYGARLDKAGTWEGRSVEWLEKALKDGREITPNTKNNNN